MSARLARIEVRTLALTALAAVAALASGRVPAFGVVVGGAVATVDLVLIRRLAMVALARRPTYARVVSLALAKSVVLALIPAGALLLPSTLVDGVSFAIGVSALPLAIVCEALLPVAPPRPSARGAT